MRIAILADIHANLEAFDAVSADLAPRGLDAVVCLGDLIGYGPDPEEVVRRVMGLGYRVVMGNHEAALTNPKARGWLNFQARENNIRTEGMLSKESLAFCAGLPLSLSLAGGHFVHGFPPDSVLTYLYNVSDERINRLFTEEACRLYFVGHTHDLTLISRTSAGLSRNLLPLGLSRLQREQPAIINAGSVGQPRDFDRRAKYLLWDSEQWTVEVVAVPYTVATTIAKIRALGLPDAYADRLG